MGIKPINVDTIYLCRSIHSLPYALQVIIRKSFYQGYTVSEISKQLNIPEATVKTKMRTALKQLRDDHDIKKKLVRLY